MESDGEIGEARALESIEFDESGCGCASLSVFGRFEAVSFGTFGTKELGKEAVAHLLEERLLCSSFLGSTYSKSASGSHTCKLKQLTCSLDTSLHDLLSTAVRQYDTVVVHIQVGCARAFQEAVKVLNGVTLGVVAEVSAASPLQTA